MAMLVFTITRNSMDGWSVTDAKARASDVMDRARSDGPRLITRNDRKAVTIASIEELGA